MLIPIHEIITYPQCIRDHLFMVKLAVIKYSGDILISLTIDAWFKGNRIIRSCLLSTQTG